MKNCTCGKHHEGEISYTEGNPSQLCPVHKEKWQEGFEKVLDDIREARLKEEKKLDTPRMWSENELREMMREEITNKFKNL